MAKIKVLDLEGTKVDEVEVADRVFAAEVKEHLLWEVVRYQRAVKRSGSVRVQKNEEK